MHAPSIHVEVGGHLRGVGSLLYLLSPEDGMRSSSVGSSHLCVLTPL